MNYLYKVEVGGYESEEGIYYSMDLDDAMTAYNDILFKYNKVYDEVKLAKCIDYDEIRRLINKLLDKENINFCENRNLRLSKITLNTIMKYDEKSIEEVVLRENLKFDELAMEIAKKE